MLRGATWADYQRAMEIRGEHSAPRICFLEGRLEIMSPSSDHEAIKSNIGRLVETWCLERDVEFRTVGSWTLQDEAVDRGVEPDDCWIFGDVPDAKRPHLAIEVVWTSGGIRKLDIYRKLGVPEVWFWRKGRLTPHVLRGEDYEEVERSEALPGVDLGQLASFLGERSTSAAIRAYRDALRAGR